MNDLTQDIIISILNEVDAAKAKHPDWPTDQIYEAAIVQTAATYIRMIENAIAGNFVYNRHSFRS